MRRLSHSVTLTTPSTFALAFLQTYFLEYGPRTSGTELALRFPLPNVLIDGLTIEKRVNVHLKYTTNGGGDHPLMIDWQPLGKGPLPSFAGVLTATPQGDTACGLTIAGGYTAPGGVTGAIFDELIGVRIAHATLAALLEQFKRSIETDYAIRIVP